MNEYVSMVVDASGAPYKRLEVVAWTVQEAAQAVAVSTPASMRATDPVFVRTCPPTRDGGVIVRCSYYEEE